MLTYTERRRHARSSVADLRILYANQMQTLHAQVEGSSKFAPTTPGRHVVLEMDGIFALNAATYKIDHAVRFIVLDDAVLVAKRRRRRNAGGEGSSSAGRSAQGKLMAERCWPLSEMLVLDTKDSASRSLSFLKVAINYFHCRHNKCFQNPPRKGDACLSHRNCIRQKITALTIPSGRGGTRCQETQGEGR